jgi:hypothetical protein
MRPMDVIAALAEVWRRWASWPEPQVDALLRLAPPAR